MGRCLLAMAFDWCGERVFGWSCCFNVPAMIWRHNAGSFDVYLIFCLLPNITTRRSDMARMMDVPRAVDIFSD